MRDVEELLRETLTDPRRRLASEAGLYEQVRAKAGERRRNRWMAASSAVAVVAIAAVATTVTLGGRHSSPATSTTTAPPSPASSPAQGALGADVNVGTGAAQSVAMADDGSLYALTSNPAVGTSNPNEVVWVLPPSSNIRATAPGPNGVASGIAVGDGAVWAWSQQTGEIRAYDEASLQPLGTFHTAAESIFNGAIVGGQLWLTTASGLVHTPATPTASSGALQVVTVPGVGSGAYGLGVDATHDKLFVGVYGGGGGGSTFSGVQVFAVDARTDKPIAISPALGLGKESIAVVDGQVWVGGYGYAGPNTPLVQHLDENTLQPIGSTPAAADTSPGATVWPGQKVVWVQAGASEQLTCIDPGSGRVLAHWPVVQGPVVSRVGHAYAIAPNLKQLPLAGGCAG